MLCSPVLLKLVRECYILAPATSWFLAQLIFDPEDGGDSSSETLVHMLTARRYVPAEGNKLHMPSSWPSEPLLVAGYDLGLFWWRRGGDVRQVCPQGSLYQHVPTGQRQASFMQVSSEQNCILSRRNDSI
jgi:hypothetical protein